MFKATLLQRRNWEDGGIVEQAVGNWGVLDWVVDAPPLRAIARGATTCPAPLGQPRCVRLRGRRQVPRHVFVSIKHSCVAPTRINEEYTRLIGTKGGVDLNSGTFSYRPDPKRLDQVVGGPETKHMLLALEVFVNSARTRSEPVKHGCAAVLTCLVVRASVDARAAVMIDRVA